MKKVIFCNLDLETGIASITIKTTTDGVDSYETKDNVNLNQTELANISAILDLKTE